MARQTTEQVLRVDGHRVRLTRPDKVLYPSARATKRDIADYYLGVASVMLPHLVGRPITRKRWPDGVDEDSFFEKNLTGRLPSWLPTRVRHQSRRDVRYPLADSAAVLAWLAQRASLELHVPQWRFDRRGREQPPDRLVLDLDPGPGVGLAECAAVALSIRDMIGARDRPVVPVTSGSKGIHLYLGLDGSLTSEEASEWAHDIARTIERARPDGVVSRMTKSARRGKVLIDWSQNSAEKTTIAPYSLRGRPGATVAAPRQWAELEDDDLAQIDFREVTNRLADRGDPLADLGTVQP